MGLEEKRYGIKGGIEKGGYRNFRKKIGGNTRKYINIILRCFKV